MKPQVEIYDTTLRDGSQGDANFSVADKLRIAEKLDSSVHYIEGGWPGSNPARTSSFCAGYSSEIASRQTRRLRLDAQKEHARRADDQVRLPAARLARPLSPSTARPHCCT